MSDPRGPYIETQSHILFRPFDPRPYEVDIEDIAVALSRKPRFDGHSPLSIAEHSLVVRRIVKNKLNNPNPIAALIALLHDAPEAYGPDVARPIKELLLARDPVTHKAELWEATEQRILGCILRALVPVNSGLLVGHFHDVRLADDAALYWEAVNYLNSPHEWAKCPPHLERFLPQPDDRIFSGMYASFPPGAHRIRQVFLDTFHHDLHELSESGQ